MERLDFSHNWNRAKLDCQAFTTLRLSGRLEVGQMVEIWLKKGIKGAAVVVDKKRLANIDAINDWMAYLDTGYNAQECREIIRKMYPRITGWDNQPIYYYLLRYTK